MFIMGDEGYLEIRKNIDIARSRESDHVFLVNQAGEQYLHPQGAVDYPFFGRLIRDCLDRTETAMTQEHTFKAAELSLLAEKMALKVGFAESDALFG